MKKFCPKCQTLKAIDDFGLDASRPDGHYSYCKRCASQRMKRVYDQTKPDVLKRVAAYKRQHRTRYNELARQAYHADRPAARQACRRKRAQRTPEQQQHYRQYRAVYLQEHLVEKARREADRRAKKQAAFVESVDRRVVHARDGGRCWICNKPVSLKKMHLDHVIPLDRDGEHSYANCRTACARCNLRKANKLPEELEVCHS